MSCYFCDDDAVIRVVVGICRDCMCWHILAIAIGASGGWMIGMAIWIIYG